MSPRVRRLAIGLGNPGPEYEGTRHNIGFDALDRLAGRLGLLFRSPRHLDGWNGTRALSVAVSTEVDGAGPRAFAVAKPQTFMNLSGEAVLALRRWAGIDPKDVLVVYDDLDLEPAILRLRQSGGHGGHNGMRSIIDALGTNAFPRLRIGIGRASTDAVRHVLGRFQDSERAALEVALAEAGEALEAWLGGEELDRLMTRFQSRWTQGG